MATIDDRKIIDQMIQDNGETYCKPDVETGYCEPPVMRIVQYTNAWGGTSYGVVWFGEPNWDRYLKESQYIRHPFVIWEREELLTQMARGLYTKEI